MARPSVKRKLVWNYIDDNWPFAKKDSIVRDTGVSPSYAYKMLREYELIQKSLGNVHSSGRIDNEVTSKRELVLNYIAANWPATQAAIVQTCDVSPSYAYKMIREYDLEEQRSDGTVTRSVYRSKHDIKSPQVHKTQQWGEKLGQEAQLESTMQVSEGTSDGSTASYYELPDGATELQDLISYKNMNAQIGEIFRACMRYGESSHSNELRDAKKIMFYIEAEIKRLDAEERIAKIIGGLDA